MARYFRRRKFCRFTAENVAEIDYKDVATFEEIVEVVIVNIEIIRTI